MNFDTAYRPFRGRANREIINTFKGIGLRVSLLGVLGLSLGSLAGAKPAHSASNVENACKLMQERAGWYRSASAVSQKWQVPVPSLLAIIRHESRFKATAAAPQSSAYGFAQALDGTWDRYQKVSNAEDADRTNFADSIDFIGWYMTETRKRAGVPADDMANHYLAYHEGIAGFRSARWREKPRLIHIAQKVAQTAGTYGQQLENCIMPEWVDAPEVSTSPRQKPFALSNVIARLPTLKPNDRYVAELASPFGGGR